MTVFGYARVSTSDQSLAVQLAALHKAGCELIRSEQLSGTTRNGRKALAGLLAEVRRGDTIVITRIDRLARSIVDLMTIVNDLKARGVTLRATEQMIDPTTPAGAAFVGMLGIFSEFETAIRGERQREGIARANAAGVYVGHGRPSEIDSDRVRALKGVGKGASEIARSMGISRASVYRVLECAP